MGFNSSAATLQTASASPPTAETRGLRPLLVGNYHARYGTPGICEQVAMRLREIGIEPVGASHRRSGLARAAHMLWVIWARRHEYDVATVDLFSGRAFRWGEAAAWALHRLGKPFALMLHGGCLPEFAAAQPQRVRRTLARATRVFAPSRFLQRQLEPYRADIELLPNPLDLPRYPFRLREAAAPRLIWLRAFHGVYDAPLAVRLLARLRKLGQRSAHVPALARLADATLTMVGPDKGDGSRQRTEAVAHELGVAHAVRFTGPVPKTQVPSHLAAADVFINTTTADNTPVSVLEAMACGLCVVSTNVGGLPDLITHEHDGLLVSPREVDEMATAVQRILCDPELAARLSRNARQTAEQVSWDNVLPRWLDVLGTLGMWQAAGTSEGGTA